MDQQNLSMTKPKKIVSHWWSKTFIGCVLGFTLALALMGLFAWLGPGGIAPGTKTQFNMWMIPPIWMVIFSTVYLFRTRWHALAWIGGANLVAYAALFYVRGVFF